MVYLDIEEILRSQAKLSDDLDYFYYRIQECNRSALLLLAKKEKIIKEQIQNGLNDNNEKELKYIRESLKQFGIQKDFLIKKVESSEAKLAKFISTLTMEQHCQE